MSEKAFKTITGLNELFDIDGDETLSKDNFSHPVRSYRLYKPEAKCQYLKRSTPCRKEHQHGYVVKTNNGKHVLIGHCCAEKHLGIEDKEIKNSFSKLRQAEDFEFRTKRASKFLTDRDKISADLKALSKEAETLCDNAFQIIQLLPHEVVRLLVDRFKRRNFEILWKYSRTKEVIENGKKKTEVTWYPLKFKPLKGLGNWLQPRRNSLKPKIDAILHELEELPNQIHLERGDLKKAESIIKQLSRFNAMKGEIAKQNNLLQEFCTKENLKLLMQITGNQKLRAEIVCAEHAILGKPHPSQPARVVSEFDNGLRKENKASGLKLAS